MKYRHGLVGKGDGDYATFLTVSQVIATRRRREQAGWCPGEHSHPLIALLKMRHCCSAPLLLQLSRPPSLSTSKAPPRLP